jgi:hypothetical protein
MGFLRYHFFIEMKKPLLIILDLNGTLLFRLKKQFRTLLKHKLEPDFKMSQGIRVYKRPKLEEFIQRLTRTFYVATWTSSKKKNSDVMVCNLFPEGSLEFQWDRSKCDVVDRDGVPVEDEENEQRKDQLEKSWKKEEKKQIKEESIDESKESKESKESIDESKGSKESKESIDESKGSKESKESIDDDEKSNDTIDEDDQLNKKKRAKERLHKWESMKPIAMKDLNLVWKDKEINANGKWSCKNTILIDDSVEKADKTPRNVLHIPSFDLLADDYDFNSDNSLLDLLNLLEKWDEKTDIRNHIAKKGIKRKQKARSTTSKRNK